MRRRDFITGAAALAAYSQISESEAMMGPRRVLLGGKPGWVLPGASAAFDFANGRYWGGTLTNMLAVSRASVKTDLLPTSASGYAYNTFLANTLAITPGKWAIIEQAQTNLFLNSAVPVGQPITLPATGQYVTWCNGSGSVTVAAGTATITGAGVATSGSPNVINCSVTGTITVTISGSLNAVQVEALTVGASGVPGTSFIPTLGVSAARAKDAVTFIGAALAAISGSAFSAVFVGTLPMQPTGSGFPILADAGSPFDTQLYGTINPVWGSFAVSGGGLADGALSINTLQKAAIASDASGRSLVANNGTVVSDANKVSPVSSINFGGAGIILPASLQIIPARVANATLKAFTA